MKIGVICSTNLFYKSMLRDPRYSYLTFRDDNAIYLSPSTHRCFNLSKNEVLYCLSHLIRCALLPCPCGCGTRPKPPNFYFELWVLCVLFRQSLAVLLKMVIARWRRGCEHAIITTQKHRLPLTSTSTFAQSPLDRFSLPSWCRHLNYSG